MCSRNTAPAGVNAAIRFANSRDLGKGKQGGTGDMSEEQEPDVPVLELAKRVAEHMPGWTAEASYHAA